MKRLLLCFLILLCLPVCPALADNDGDCVYVLLDESGKKLTTRAGRIYEGDEYISADDQLYTVISVDDSACSATARCLGSAAADKAAFAAFLSASAEKKEAKKLICMYSTHSDESYVPDDGASSLWKNAGIYDVGNALKENLEKHGIEVEYSDESFLPHDADAYTRSRSTTETYAKKIPAAIIDIHRDGVDADEYETEVDGEETSMVRLFVGRSNVNAAENKAFAQQLKAAADKAYPGLVKDIFIGKGNYNQDLYQNAVLMEFGTYEIDKDKAVSATKYMADVIDEVLFGETAKASVGEKNSRAAVGIAWAVGIAVALAIVFTLVATGRFGPMWTKLKRGVNEVTLGLFGKK